MCRSSSNGVACPRRGWMNGFVISWRATTIWAVWPQISNAAACFTAQHQPLLVPSKVRNLWVNIYLPLDSLLHVVSTPEGVKTWYTFYMLFLFLHLHNTWHIFKNIKLLKKKKKLPATPLEFLCSLKGRTTFQLENLPGLALFVIKFDWGPGSVSILQTQQINNCPGLSRAVSSAATTLSKNHLGICRVRLFTHAMGKSACLSLFFFCNMPLVCIILEASFYFKEISDILWILPEFKLGNEKNKIYIKKSDIY